MKSVITTIIVALVAIPTFAAPAGEAAPAANVVSQLRYSPNPLYDDDFVVSVSFKTSRAARPGYEWGVAFSISGAEPIGACSSLMLSWDGKFGGNPRKHQRTAGTHYRQLTANRYGGRFCKGRGSLIVSEHKIGADSFGRPLGVGSTLFGFRIVGS